MQLRALLAAAFFADFSQTAKVDDFLDGNVADILFSLADQIE